MHTRDQVADESLPHVKPAPSRSRAAPGTPATAASRAEALGSAGILGMQRAAGNRAVTGLLTSAQQPQGAVGDLPRRGFLVQRDIAQSMPTARGVFEIGMIAKEDALTGTGWSGLGGDIAFQPAATAPYTNKLGLVQIVKITDKAGGNVDVASMPAASAPHLRTKADPGTGVEAGFFTDVLHQRFGVSPPVVAPKGQAHASYYEGNTPVFGFRRSEKAEDIKAAKITDHPRTTDPKAHLDFSFETVAKGDDNQLNYGSIRWSFGVHAGKVVNETASVSDDASATYEAALALHQDFYVHEPVTIYFDFNADTPAAGETPKLDALMPYLNKFPDVRIKAEGFADLRGSTAHNLALARRRATSCINALVSLGVDRGRFDAPVGTGATSSFTADAVSPQDREANRRGNRRVMLTFEHTASTP
jgi:outer membrane protein OmpA-like peptidoglycan-associated protein